MKQEKSKYSAARIEILRFETEDVITTSVIHNDVGDPGINLPIDPFGTIDSVKL